MLLVLYVRQVLVHWDGLMIFRTMVKYLLNAEFLIENFITSKEKIKKMGFGLGAFEKPLATRVACMRFHEC